MVRPYNAAGNRTEVDGTWARTALPQSVGSATYDAANQMLTFGSQTLAYDANGNLTSDGSKTYTWNVRNQLASMTGASFGYDGLGRRLQRTVGGTTTDFLYDGINPVQELSGGTPTANLLTGLGIDEYFTRGTETLLTDVLGSTVALTDSNGTVQTEYTYEPFGATTATGTASTNSFNYTGREDDETGLYYYRARYYHPFLQRFISEDPIEFAGGDVNLYAYVWNNPTNLIDPSGQSPLVAACLGGALLDIGITTGLDMLAGRKVTLGGIAAAGVKGCASGLVGFGLGKALGALGRAGSLADDAALAGGLTGRTGFTTFGRSVESLKQFLSLGKGPWQRISAHAEQAMARAYRGGVSIEEVFVNQQTGERIIRHTIVRGNQILHETYRKFAKFGLE